jgi:hypothetical protein
MDKVSDNLVDETKKPFIVPRTVQKDEKDRGLWRDLLSYWIFGLCNNYGTVWFENTLKTCKKKISQTQLLLSHK